MRRIKIATLTICSALMLSACESQRDLMVEQGFPVAYADGFEDGCHSGKQAGGSLFDQFQKDVERFETDARYAQGWSDGYRQCETQEEALERNARVTTEWQRMDKQRQRRMEHEALRGLDTSGLENLQ